MLNVLPEKQGHFRVQVKDELVETSQERRYHSKAQMLQHVLADVFNSLERQTEMKFKTVGVEKNEKLDIEEFKIFVDGRFVRVPLENMPDGWEYVSAAITQLDKHIRHESSC